MKVVYFTFFTFLFSAGQINAQENRREGGNFPRKENTGQGRLGNQHPRIENRGGHQPHQHRSNQKEFRKSDFFDRNQRKEEKGFDRRAAINPSHQQLGRHPNQFPVHNPIRVPSYKTHHSYGRPIQQFDHQHYNHYHYNNTRFYGNNGIYYKPWQNSYVRFTPPVGFSINILPMGAVTINISNRPSYFYEGVYYEQYNNDYRVIMPPIGTYIYALPSGYERIEYNKQLYYEFGGVLYDKVYYQGEKMYQVVGYLS